MTDEMTRDEWKRLRDLAEVPPDEDESVDWDPERAPAPPMLTPTIVTTNGHTSTTSSPEVTTALPFADIAAVLAGETPTTNEPGIAYTADGRGLFYSAATNHVVAEPGDGKTSLSCIAVVECLAAGGTAYFLDAEDVVERVLERAISFGARPFDLIERFRYLTYSDVVPTIAKHVDDLVAEIGRSSPPVVCVLDGVAEMLGAHGLDEDSATDYSRWHTLVPQRLAQAGAATILNDHVAKAKDGRGLWARGSGHKIGVVDGVAYSLTANPPFARDKAGVIELTIAKDRAGHVGPKRTKAARILVTPHDNGTITYRIERPLFGADDPHDPDTSTATTAAMAEIVDGILAILDGAAEPGPTRNRIDEELRSRGIRFDGKTLTPTLLRLERDQRITSRPRPGGGNYYARAPRQEQLSTDS